MLKGVNLGGWLVLEKWLTPSLFINTSSIDEYTFSSNPNNFDKLKKHRETYIIEEDFKFLANVGINSVRIPIGYWLFQKVGRFLPTVEYLDKAFIWAKKYNIKIIVDLHAAPFSQNGEDHSGKKGKIGWHKDTQNIIATQELLIDICHKYKNQKALLGIGLLNEPHYDIPMNTLIEFYKDTTYKISKILGTQQLILISEVYRPLEIINKLDKDTKNRITLDLHHYQCFSAEDKKLNLEGHINKLNREVKKMLYEIMDQTSIVVGEWSLALDSLSLTNKINSQTNKENILYGKEQLKLYNKTNGWFYWNYKSENKDNWNFKYLVESSKIKI